MIKIKNLLKELTPSIKPCFLDMEINTISINSKNVKRGDLFIALSGKETDGHNFLKEACKNGARVILVDKKKKISKEITNIIKVDDTRQALEIALKNYYHSPWSDMKMFGITGTNGKTTVSLLIKNILDAAYIPCGLIGTIEYYLGKRRLQAHCTTPGPLQLNVLLDEMKNSGLKAASMEVSSHALDQERARGILFDAAIFTNLTHEHLDYHRTLKQYLASKIKIFSQLKAGGVAVLNADDRSIKEVKKAIKGKCITYAIKNPATVSAKILKEDAEGSQLVVRMGQNGSFSINTKLPGRHNVSNILAAIAACYGVGINRAAIKRGIENTKCIEGRLAPVKGKACFKVFVDYAHTHNALENVLKFLSRIKHGKIITVFGCGGDRDKKKRSLMGSVAQKFSDFVIITNDNPRTEDPKRIAREIEKGMKRGLHNYVIITNRKQAIEKALKKALKGDIVLIAGKGHEKVQIIGNKNIPFNDKKIAESFLKNMQKNNIYGNPKKISIDSRTIKKGDIFIAIKGKNFDGHNFVLSALKKHARAVIVSKNIRVPSIFKNRIIKVKNTLNTLGEIARANRLKYNVPVIAITGSNGKTTTKDMVSWVLQDRYNVLKNDGTKNNFIGLSLTLLKLKAKHDIVVLEMGMNHLGEIDRLCEIARPDIGVISNIGPAHLGFLKTIENVFMAKSELLKHLGVGALAVLNIDDEYLKRVKMLKCRKIYFGIKSRCAFQAKGVRHENNKWIFSVSNRKNFELDLSGKHNIYNALIAILLGRQFNIGFSRIRQRITSYKQVSPMRLELGKVKGATILNDSYNSNLLSMKCAIDALGSFRGSGKKIVVSGDMLELGKQARAMHEAAGEIISERNVDALITLGKLSKFMNKKAKHCGMENLYHAESHKEAARFLKKIVSPGDVVLVKGSRGMRMEKVIERFKKDKHAL